MPTILFAQQKGGSGKSTLLTQLAAHWQGTGVSVGIVDLDAQGSTTGWAAARTASGRPAIEVAASTDWKAGSDIGTMAKRHSLVLVDAPGDADSLRRSPLRAADFALIPCAPSMADVWATGAMLEMTAKAKTPHGVVLNRCPPRGKAIGIAADALGVEGASVLATRVGARSAFVDAFMTGSGATESQPRSKAADEIRALATEIESHLGPF